MATGKKKLILRPALQAKVACLGQPIKWSMAAILSDSAIIIVDIVGLQPLEMVLFMHPACTFLIV